MNGTLFFKVIDSVHGEELWQSDGTIEGTRLVKDILSGSGGSDPGDLIVLDGTLFFSAYDDFHGYELWKSDGTADGTILVKDINPESDFSRPYGLTNVNDRLFFSADDGDHGMELWGLCVAFPSYYTHLPVIQR